VTVSAELKRMPQNKFRTGTIEFLCVKIRSDVPRNTNKPDLILGLWLGFSRLFTVPVKVTV